jgi:hypothetical protein
MAEQQSHPDVPVNYLRKDPIPDRDVMVDISRVGATKKDQTERIKLLTSAYKATEVFIGMLSKIPSGSGLAMLKLSNGYSYDPEMRCYDAVFRPNYTVASQLFHRSYGYGQIMAMHIPDLRKCKFIKSGEGMDVVGIESELKWVCTSNKRDSITEPIDSIVAATEDYDRRPWSARLNGPNSFIGLYALDRAASLTTPGMMRDTTPSSPSTAAVEPMPGMLVLYTSSLYNQEANYTKLKDSERKPSYIEYATDVQQSKLRDLQRRNAMRMLHDAMVALGLGSEIADRSFADTVAYPTHDEKDPDPPTSTDRTSLLDSLRAVPMLINPHVHNETDLLLPHNDYETGAPNCWVSYYD